MDDLMKPAGVLFKGKPLAHVVLRSEDMGLDLDALYGFHSAVLRLQAKVIDMQNEAIIDAVICAAREEGIDELYLLDKSFVLEALTEKIQREREKHE